MTSNNLDDKTAVTVNNGKAFRDAFANPNVLLYIPVTDDGTIVDPAQATSLYCWKVREGYERSPIPDLFARTENAITKVLLREQGSHEFGSLARTAAFCSIAKMELWLKTLTRHNDGDIRNITVYQK